MEASIRPQSEEMDERKASAVSAAEDFVSSVQSVLAGHNLDPELTRAILDDAYAQRYSEVMNDESDELAEVVELGPRQEAAGDEVQPGELALQSLHQVVMEIHGRVMAGESFDSTTELEDEEDVVEPEEESESTPEIIYVNGRPIDPAELNLTPGQLFILRNLGEVDPRKFTRSDFLYLGYETNREGDGAEQAFAHEMPALMQMLEEHIGEPVSVSAGQRGGRHYELITTPNGVPVTRTDDGTEANPYNRKNLGKITIRRKGEKILPDRQEAPAADEEPEQLADDVETRPPTEEQPQPEPEARQAEVQPPVEEPETQRAPEKPTPIRLRRSSVKVFSDDAENSAVLDLSNATGNGRLAPEKIKPLDEVLANIEPRDPAEVKDNMELKRVINGILNEGKIDNYRTKVVMAVRYGLYPPNFQRIATTLNRQNTYLKLSEIMRDHIPANQGVNIATASQLTELEPAEVLRIEAAFLQAHKSKTSEVKELAEAITKQYQSLVRLTARMAGEN